MHLKEEIVKKRPQMKKKKSALSPRQCTVSQVNRNDSKTTWIALQMVSALTLFSRSGPQQLLAVCQPQKNAPGKEIGSNEKVISETEVYFEAKDKLFYKKGIE